jgi:hypothetical protein
VNKPNCENENHKKATLVLVLRRRNGVVGFGLLIFTFRGEIVTKEEQGATTSAALFSQPDSTLYTCPIKGIVVR